MGTEALVLGRCWGARQCEVESAPQSDVTLNPNPSVVRFDDSFRNRESETDSAPIRRPRLPESSEDVRELLRGYARAGVDHGKSHFTICRRAA